MHGAEMILHYICGATEIQEDKKDGNERWILCILSEKEEQYTIEAMDYPAIIEMNRRISMQMITLVSTQHYDSNLENNDGKWDDIIKDIKQERGALIPTRPENRIRRNVSIGLYPGEATRSLESSLI